MCIYMYINKIKQLHDLGICFVLWIFCIKYLNNTIKCIIVCINIYVINHLLYSCKYIVFNKLFIMCIY